MCRRITRSKSEKFIQQRHSAIAARVVLDFRGRFERGDMVRRDLQRGIVVSQCAIFLSEPG